MLDMVILLAAVVEYALLSGAVANNCAKLGSFVSRGGGVCAVIGVRWLTIVLDMVTLLAAVVEYALLSGAAANNCARYGYIVSRGGGVCAVAGGGG
ncbi:MAG TPA: hypothetical protein DCR12_05280 [Lachnospiraceae bacterium]|nr:hypothetical protein [Lachnospiraceae bacterium]